MSLKVAKSSIGMLAPNFDELSLLATMKQFGGIVAPHLPRWCMNATYS
jgi:hypothetical protein